MTDEEFQKEMLERMIKLEGSFQELVGVFDENSCIMKQKLNDFRETIGTGITEIKSLSEYILKEAADINNQLHHNKNNLLELANRLENLGPKIQ